MCHINEVSKNTKNYTRDISRSVLLCSLFCLWLEKTRWNLIPDLLYFLWTQCLPPSETSWSKAFLFIYISVQHNKCHPQGSLHKTGCINLIRFIFMNLPLLCVCESSQQQLWSPCLPEHNTSSNISITVHPRVQNQLSFWPGIKGEQVLGYTRVTVW